MKNKNGQILILFVLLIPVFIMALALIFDSAFITLEDAKLSNIAKMALKDVIENNYTKEEVIAIIKKNDSSIVIKELSVGEETKIILRKDISSFFGQAVGYDHYELDAIYVGKMKNGKLMITEKG